MKLNGFVVEGITGFRKNFSLNQILDYIDSQVVFMQWLEQLDKASIGGECASYVEALREAFLCWCQERENSHAVGIDRLLQCFQQNRKLLVAFENWRFELSFEDIKLYENYCYIIILLLQLGDHEATEAEVEEIRMFTSRLFGKEEVMLMIQYFHGIPYLCNGNRPVSILYADERIKKKYGNLVSASLDEDTGFLGVTEEGNLINGSALEISVVGRTVVKALISRNHYVLLHQDGCISHNLEFTRLPECRVLDVALQGDHLVWMTPDWEIVSSVHGTCGRHEDYQGRLEDML